MTDPAPSPFSAEVVAAIARHMNDDHAEDNVTICRGLGGQPATVSATMTGLTPEGIVFAATVEPTDGEPADQVEVVVPWSEPVTERAQVRTEVVRMHTEACAALGLATEPREH